MPVRFPQQVLLFFCLTFCAGSLKGVELVEDFSSVTDQSPIVRVKHPWSNPSGRSWSFQENAEGKIALTSSPNTTEEFSNEGRVHFSLLEAPTPVRKISFQLTIDQIGAISEAMRRRSPRMLISLVKTPGGDAGGDRAAAVSISLPRASDDPSLLDRLEVGLAVDRQDETQDPGETRANLPDPASFYDTKTLNLEFSEDGTKARVSIEGGEVSDWVNLTFPVSEVGYLRISQLGLRVTIHEIRVQGL